MRPPRPASVAATLALALHGASPPAAQEVDHSQMDRAHAEHAPESHAHTRHDEAQPRTPIAVLTEADRLAAQPPAMVHGTHDRAIYSYTLVNRLEAWDGAAGTGLGWEAAGWVGGDINRLWWRSEGERVHGRTGAADLEALFGRSFAPRWGWVAGLRQDIRPRAARSFVAFGVQGLAPQWFEVSFMAYAGEGGRTAARFTAEYSLLFTNRLVLQPVLDVELHGKDDLSRGIGSGLGSAETGLRLRYEFARRFAPYVGVTWDRAFGHTARLRRAAGEDVDDTRLVAGLRLWF